MGYKFIPTENITHRLLTSLGIGLLLLAVFLLLLWFIIAQPGKVKNEQSRAPSLADVLEKHVKYFSIDCHPRSEMHIKNLNKAAAYIEAAFLKAGAKISMQKYSVLGKEYANVIGIFNEGRGDKLIIGAHYDSFGETPGADDNASGVAGLIELARLLGKEAPQREIELVAYTLEEPPNFGFPQMGSYVHAKSVVEKGEPVSGVIILEMIGYFTDEASSQEYPVPALKMMYPSVGNYIAVIGRLDQRDFTKKIKQGMAGVSSLPVYSINAPAQLPGVDFSDHRNYWAHDYNAVMVTDTAFYRNKEYHHAGDTFDRLNYTKMSDVVYSVYHTIRP